MTNENSRYLVRRYRPGYFSGSENEVLEVPSRDDITKVPWAENFKQDGFLRFEVEPCSKGKDELIISAVYKDGQRWVISFAIPCDSQEVALDGGLLRDNWRYRSGYIELAEIRKLTDGAS